jgi:Uma2 family endonuclease
MTTVEPRPMTAEQFLEFAYRPENIDRFFELDRGEVIERAFTARRQGVVCANVVGVLWSFAARQRKGYPCANRAGFIVDRNPDTVLGPDVSFYFDEQAPEHLPRTWVEEAPKLAVYVLVPQDTFSQMMRRIRRMLRRGVPLLWIVDPDARTVTVYQPGKEHFVLEGQDELTGEDVLPDFRCKVADFFRLPGEQAPQ